MMESAWVVAESPDPAHVTRLQTELDLPPSIARLLCRRGFSDVGAADRYLNPRLDHLHDPSTLAGMAGAVSRLSAALDRGERVLVHGDYDVDGITATALMHETLRALGGNVGYFIPHRIRDGYGLSGAGVAAAEESGATLIVTADCGIGSVAPIADARRRGIDTIVTDHHEVGRRRPDAVAIVNPKQAECRHPFKDYAGVGVAFKVLQGLVAARGLNGDEILAEHLDLVALGTIADVVPLRGENRVFASKGLERIRTSAKPGVRALLQQAGLNDRSLDAMDVAFSLAPRINATGRLGDSVSSIELLLSTDEEASSSLAARLDRTNTKRRALDEEQLIEALDMIEGLDREPADPVVLWSDSWHSGVLGIVASKLVERLRVPVILIAMDEDSGRGSGRSVPGFDLVAALERCDARLVEWGGHKYAVGLKIQRDELDAFRRQVTVESRVTLSALDRRPRLEIDDRLCLKDASRELAELCEKLAPFGYENAEPLFVSEGLQLLEAPQRLGDRGQHLRITAYQDGHTRECIGFGLGECADRIDRPGQRFSLVYAPFINRWRGRELTQLKLKDIRPD